MEFDLSKPQKLLRETVRAMLVKECPLKRVREWMATNASHDDSLWNSIAEQGWVGLHLEEECGGLGLGIVELAVVSEEMGRACIPSPFLATTFSATLLAHLQSSNCPSASPFPLAPSSGRGAVGEVQKRIQALLESLTAGSKKASVAFVEPDSDWNVDDVQMELESTSTIAILNGKKRFVLDADSVDSLLCVVRQNSEFAVVVVPAPAEGLKLADARGVDATRKLFDVEFNGVKLSTDDVIASGESVRSAIDYSMKVCTVAVCAEMLGAMQWILETSLEYAKTRKQFDRTIGSYQAVQHQCADMMLMSESARAATYYAAWALQTKTPDASKAVAIAKAYCSDAAREVAHRGVQIHGGIGFTWEHDIHLFLKRIKVCEFLFGDATWQREKIATELLLSLN